MSAPLHFADFSIPAPTFDEVAQRYTQFNSRFDSASSAAERHGAVADWDTYRRQLETWDALTNLHFQQDTRNEQYKAAREYLDELRPKLTDLELQFKRKLLGGPHRSELEADWGSQAFALWEADVLTYAPEIEADAVKESKLQAEYTELLAGAKIEFRGESLNLSTITKYREHADRATRHAAEQARWGWFDANRARLDDLFDQLVKLRDGMARKLGFPDFVALGYKRMKRVDYDRNDVERFRAAVREHVVPLGVKLREQQSRDLSLDRLMFWDEPVHDVRGNPAPRGDHDWMVARACEMFDAMGPELGDFFRLMIDADLMDLKSRDGKAGGGFCTGFPYYGVPYIFANFNGTKGDVEVFTHEIGHAFQCYMSRQQRLTDYLWPTYESCEIHSMGLEFLTWPHMEKFFGDDAARFRRIHLIQGLLFLPYGVAVDHFQHLVYERPNATPAERHAMWQEMERLYLPWRNYGDLPHVSAGAFWQFQRHIYFHPFYYIDYTLAQTCALQLWARSNRDFAGTMHDYVALCRRGGEAPFQALAKSAGLISPFAPDCLRDAVAQAKSFLRV